MKLLELVGNCSITLHVKKRPTGLLDLIGKSNATGLRVRQACSQNDPEIKLK